MIRRPHLGRFGRWSLALGIAGLVHGLVFLGFVDHRRQRPFNDESVSVVLERPPPPPRPSPSRSTPSAEPPSATPVRQVQAPFGLPAGSAPMAASGDGAGRGQGGSERSTAVAPPPLRLGWLGRVTDLMRPDLGRECEEERLAQASGLDLVTAFAEHPAANGDDPKKRPGIHITEGRPGSLIGIGVRIVPSADDKRLAPLPGDLPHGVFRPPEIHNDAIPQRYLRRYATAGRPLRPRA